MAGSAMDPGVGIQTPDRQIDRSDIQNLEIGTLDPSIPGCADHRKGVLNPHPRNLDLHNEYPFKGIAMDIACIRSA